MLLGLLRLLREEDRVDVREDTAGGDGDAREELVELLVVADGEVMCRGMMRDFLLSRAALPASSRTSAAMYSRTAAR